MATSSDVFKKAGLITYNVLPRAHESYPMYIYAVKKNYLKTVDLEKNDWPNDNHAQRLNLIITVADFLSDDFSNVEIQYTIARKNKTFYAYKSKVTRTSRSGSAKSVGEFKDDVTDIAKPMEVSPKTLPQIAYIK